MMQIRWSLAGNPQGKRKSTSSDYMPPAKRPGGEGTPEAFKLQPPQLLAPGMPKLPLAAPQLPEPPPSIGAHTRMHACVPLACSAGDVSSAIEAEINSWATTTNESNDASDSDDLSGGTASLSDELAGLADLTDLGEFAAPTSPAAAGGRSSSNYNDSLDCLDLLEFAGDIPNDVPAAAVQAPTDEVNGDDDQLDILDPSAWFDLPAIDVVADASTMALAQIAALQPAPTQASESSCSMATSTASIGTPLCVYMKPHKQKAQKSTTRFVSLPVQELANMTSEQQTQRLRLQAQQAEAKAKAKANKGSDGTRSLIWQTMRMIPTHR